MRDDDFKNRYCNKPIYCEFCRYGTPEEIPDYLKEQFKIHKQYHIGEDK